MAAHLRRPGTQRAVGRANGLNRVAIVVPCHRVVRSDGTMCGYGGASDARSGSDKYAPCPKLVELVEQGHLGDKTGRGVFEH